MTTPLMLALLAMPCVESDLQIFADDAPIICECPCHKTIEQGGGDFVNRDCIHCRVIG